jgi:hypothetical protein
MRRYLFFTVMVLIIAVFGVSGCKKKAEEGEVVEKEAVEAPKAEEEGVVLEEPLKLEEGAAE